MKEAALKVVLAIYTTFSSFSFLTDLLSKDSDSVQKAILTYLFQ